MKILQLGKFYPIGGGVEKVMYGLMTGMAARGVQCDMMCASTSGRGGRRTVLPGARLLIHRTWLKAASVTIAPSMVRLLRKIASDYDLIHIHHPDPMAALALYLSGYKGRVVLHWHSDIIKQKSLFMLFMPLQKWLIRRADAIVGTSPVYLAESPWLKGSESKHVCIPIGIQPLTPDTVGARAIRQRHGAKRIVFFLGRLIPYKGLNHLIEAAALLPEDYKVLIGGSGPLHDALQSQITSLGIAGKVELIGHVSDDEICAYYTAADVFCLPSVLKTEAFGIVQIEAMSLGKPVVATEIEGSGTAWVNCHGLSGLNVPAGNPEALARAIIDITDSDTYPAFSEGARQRFKSAFTFDRMIDSCLALYNRLLS